MTPTKLELFIREHFTLPANYDTSELIARLAFYDLEEITDSDLVELIDGELFSLTFKP